MLNIENYLLDKHNECAFVSIHKEKTPFKIIMIFVSTK